MHIGCQAPFSVVRLGNGVAWIGEERCAAAFRRAYHAVGYNPVPVSTPAVEAAWAQHHTIQDAVAYVQMDGGQLVLWGDPTFPGANATWALRRDHRVVAIPQRGWWNTSANNWDRIRTWVHCAAKLDNVLELHYGGDWSTGQVYVMGTNYKTDDGHVVWRRRRAPHLTRSRTCGGSFTRGSKLIATSRGTTGYSGTVLATAGTASGASGHHSGPREERGSHDPL